MSIKKQTLPAVLRSQRLLEYLWFYQTESFTIPIQTQREHFKSPPITNNRHWIVVLRKGGWVSVVKLFAEIAKRNKEFVKTLPEDDKQKLTGDINQIISNNKLGREWYPCILGIISSGAFMPPPFNFNIENNPASKEVKISLNGSTSLEDIIQAWPQIEAARDSVVGTVKRMNVTDGFITDLELHLRTQDIETDGNTDVVFGNLSKLTDADIVGMLFPDEGDMTETADRKRVSRLRQAKHRLKILR